jgi:protein-S-isoprenylcysteine O-methyltransferase Ste14
MTLADGPLAHLGFASLHLLVGHLGAAALHWLRFGKSPLVLYRGRASRHQRVTRLVSALAAAWTGALVASALWPAFRDALPPLGAVPPALAWGLAAAGLLLMAAAQASMGASFRVGQDDADAPPELRSGGLHARTRNPIYVGSWLALLGMTFWWPSALLLALCGALGAGMHALVLEEERFLERTFGAAFLEYRARVPRYLPGIRW